MATYICALSALDKNNCSRYVIACRYHNIAAHADNTPPPPHPENVFRFCRDEHLPNISESVSKEEDIKLVRPKMRQFINNTRPIKTYIDCTK